MTRRWSGHHGKPVLRKLSSFLAVLAALAVTVTGRKVKGTTTVAVVSDGDIDNGVQDTSLGVVAQAQTVLYGVTKYERH